MSEFLSDERFAAIETEAAAADVPEGLTLSIEQAVVGEPTVRWQIRIGANGVALDRDPSTAADVRITTDLDTATRIQAGEASAQRAFLDGSLQIGGDIQALMDHRQALVDLAPALGLG